MKNIEFTKEELKLIYDALVFRTVFANDEYKLRHNKKYQKFEDIKMKIRGLIE